ncbi:hypothetical protein GCM10009844_30460 [Nocardioides koreensis]|uniref:Ig-like domain-containing protein n=1 Tax=Nocardioides koreensis TaxID=433651 RepID=A0ABP5LMB9_9ACTN
MELHTDVVTQYADFAAYARGYSPCLEEWSLGVVDDPEVQAWIAGLPGIKQQPNLVFAAARWHGVPAPGAYAALRDALLGDDGRIRATILERSTQTNEAGRLATLTPAFAALSAGEPMALLEVGASAGLCLYPDRYHYEWSTDGGTVTAGDGPTLACAVTGPAPLPAEPPTVAWRGGVDLNPLDVTDDDAMRWLTTLVFPEHDERRALLEQAIAVARTEPPEIVRGNLLEELPDLVDRVAAHGPVVVFHTAVIAYLEPDDRVRFHEMMTGLVAEGRCHWVSNEGKRVLPDVTATGPEVPDELATFVMGIDGRAVAWTHGHGHAMTWLG